MADLLGSLRGALPAALHRTRLDAGTMARAGLLALVIARLTAPIRRPDPSRRRHAGSAPERATPVTVVVPARDEALRIGRLLDSLAPLDVEVLVIDDGSTDDTAAIARSKGAKVIDAGPLPTGWAGKAHALDVGIRAATTPIVVTLDADTTVAPDLLHWVRSLCAPGSGPVLVSAGARIDVLSRGERWLHPAMLATLVYRFGPPGSTPTRPERSMANGQCMIIDRERILASGGLSLVHDRLTEDIALARALAARGHGVRFVDGTRHVTVAGYGTFGAAWTGWGRSLDLAEVTSPVEQAFDLVVVWATMAVPLPRLVSGRGDLLDAVAVALRIGTLVGTRSAYTRTGLPFALSAFADPLVAARITWGTVHRDRRWRGRDYR